MDLKIKDVADLLNVSETTIRRWLAEGKIPAYRINHQYRFSRYEIQDWVMSHKLGHYIFHISPTRTSTSKRRKKEAALPKGGNSNSACIDLSIKAV